MTTPAWRSCVRLLAFSSTLSLSLLAPVGGSAHAAPGHGPLGDPVPVHVEPAPHGLRGAPLAESRAQERRARVAARLEARAELGERALAAARTRAGSPYVYGASGPDAFDCSGLVLWAFRQVGVELPRTAAAQAAAVEQVSDPRPGDLVFFSSGGHVYHVGFYEGPGMVWHASRPGVPVGEEALWTSSVFYGRVR